MPELFPSVHMYPKPRLKEIITDHFNYEVTELAQCQVLCKFVIPKLQNLFINMNLEHTLLHSRNLFEFYYILKHREKYNDDSYPRANMYVPDFKQPAYTVNIKADDKEKKEPGFYTQVSNQIIHIGNERTSDPTKKFTLGEALNIGNDLLKITIDFLDRLKPVDKGYYFDGPLPELRKMLDSAIQKEPFPSR